MQPKTPPGPEIPDLVVPRPTTASEAPPASGEEPNFIERSPSFPPPDSARFAGEWAEYSDAGSSAAGSIPPPRTSGFIRARRPRADVGFDDLPLAPSEAAAGRPRTPWVALLAFGPGVLLVAASVVMTFFDQRSAAVGAPELDSRPPTWIAALTCCLGLLSIALGARRAARQR